MNRNRAPPDPLHDATARIRRAVMRVPRGRVTTYGSVARMAGLPGRARLVGTVLKALPAGARVPWHRVITASGRIAFPVGSEAHDHQRRKLEDEGVGFRGGRVDLGRFGWPGHEDLDEMLWGAGR